MVTMHEIITILVSMQSSISSLQTHNVNICGRSRHLARKLSLRRKRSSPNLYEFFFSSRRRHTSSLCDWSSDVCSSDLFNLGSRVLSLCQRRLPGDWEEAFGHGVVLLETFVDPQRHRGTVYRAANWMYVGNTRGYRRTHGGYTATPQTPKMVFLRPLRPDACQILCGAILSPPYRLGGTTMRLPAEQMRSLPSFFSQISDPRRAQGRRHRLSMVLGIAPGAVP